MANLFDYLSWRADVPFSADPFNEVDNMILSELSYARFDGIVPKDGETVSLKAAAEAYFSFRTREEVLAEKGYTARAPLLMDGMLSGQRFADTKLCFYYNKTDIEKEAQFSAVTFLLPNGSAYIAFRGTDGTLIGWKEDFNFSFITETEGQNRAVWYLERVMDALDPKTQVLIGGHSKGGNLAVFASAFCDPSCQERIERVYSNDGPGLREELTVLPGYERILPKVVKIIPDTSVIGLLLSSKVTPRVIRSSAFGIVQHDGFTWNVERNRFESADLSTAGELIRTTFGGWLEQLDDETRRSFFDTVFELAASTGKDTIGEINEQKFRSTEAILNALLSLPKEKRQELFMVLEAFGKSGGRTAADHLKALMNREKE